MDQINFYVDLIPWPHWAELKYLNISLKLLLTASLAFIIVYLLLKVLMRIGAIVAPKLTKAPPLKDIARASFEGVRPWTLTAIALYVTLQGFALPERFEFIMGRICLLILTIQLLLIANIWIRFIFHESLLFSKSHSQIRTMSGSLTSIAIIGCWAFGFLLLLDNFGFDVATVIAGLGIGGIAIGLALQSVLGDIIASFSIGFDSPFEVGDFIIVGGAMGTVERVGLKTTRIRSLGGELLVFPNAKLVNSNIQNYKRMQQRRIVFQLSLRHDTPHERLEEMPQILKSAVESNDKTRFDRAHLAKFVDSSLLFEVVYYVLVPDYNIYMDIQQEINLRIRKECQTRGISFAFPTRTLDLPQELTAALTAFAPKDQPKADLS